MYAEERERYSELFREAARQRGPATSIHSEAGIALVALVDGAWIELLMTATDFSVDDALALCDHYIDMVLQHGEADRQRTAEAESAMTED